jgi:hypothetical protein
VHPIALGLERVDQKIADPGIVFDDQYERGKLQEALPRT